jgi:hypothetical protein
LYTGSIKPTDQRGIAAAQAVFDKAGIQPFEAARDTLPCALIAIIESDEASMRPGKTVVVHNFTFLDTKTIEPRLGVGKRTAEKIEENKHDIVPGTARDRRCFPGRRYRQVSPRVETARLVANSIWISCPQLSQIRRT